MWEAAAAGADVVFTMVTDDAAARQVWLDEAAGALHGLKPGAIAIESSTVTPAFVRELAARVAAREARFLDAPVAGSRPQAEAGQLVFMVGGEAGTIAAARPLLEVLGARVIPVGTAGQGAVLKLAVNTLFAAQLASLAELLGFLSDHIEVVWDLDHEARATADRLGLRFERVPTVGTDRGFVAGLVDLLAERAAQARGEHPDRPVVTASPRAAGCAPDCCAPTRRTRAADAPAALGE